MIFRRSCLLMFCCALLVPRLDATQPTWVHFGTNGLLVYTNDDLGNHLIDYSYAGYESGGVAIPTNGLIRTTLSPLAGDNTAQIQNAITSVGGMSADTNGVRGVILLNPGSYEIDGTLSLNKSGVILRGSGTNTLLHFTSTAASGNAITIGGSSGATQVGSTTYTIADSYVPLGATNFHLNTTSGLSVGTGVVVRRPWTTTWINAVGMSNLWSASGHQNDAERSITAINGTQVTVDIPLPTPIEQKWCTGTVFPYTDPGRVQQVGLENMQLNSDWGLATTGNTNNFGWTGAHFGNAKNCWVRNVLFNGFGIGANAATSSQTKWCTVQDCGFMNGVNNGSARPPAFEIDGQMCLFQRLNGISGFQHLLQTGDEATGPNVYLYSHATGSDFDGGPHRFWAVSLLTDNEYGTVGNVHIVIITGGNNGWGAGYSVFYNCHTSNHTIQCPAVDHHYNWWIGGSGVNNNPTSNPGTYDHDGTTVTPTSLYLEQLKERLGGQAVENIGYPLFTISNSPASRVISPGNSTTFNVLVGDPTLMSNTVALAVSGLPAGASATLSTNAVTGAGSATLTVIASNSIAPGIYTLNLAGTSAGLTHTSSVSLVVGSFSLAASPAAQTILAGTGTNYTVTLTTNSSFTGNVVFGVTGLPFGANASFSPTSLAANGNSTLSITTAGNTPGGTYPLTINGTNGGTIGSVSVTLNVAAIVASPGTLVWTNGAADNNWSSQLNWTNFTSGGFGPAGISNDVVFTNFSTAVASNSIDNVVNGNITINSLTYENTNGFHTTQIAPGNTLSVLGSGGLLVGTESDLGNAASVNTTITGAGGSLVISNTSANLVVRQACNASSSASLKATLNLSGLDNFSATLARVELGALGSVARPCGILYLAKTNSITVTGSSPAIILGGQGGTTGGNGGNGSLLFLGQNNSLFADSISVGTVKQAGCSISFNPTFTNNNPSALIRGANGSSPVANWFIADSGSSAGTVNTSGACDFSGGIVDILVNNLTVARSSTGAGTGNPTGTLTFSGGTMNIGTLQISLQGSSSANFPTANVNVNGTGQLLVSTNLILSQVAGGTGAGNAVGILNINGGTVLATNISGGGGGTSAINLNTGLMDLQAGNPFPGVIASLTSLNIGTNSPIGSALLENAASIQVSNTISIDANGTLAGNTFITAPGLVVNGTLAPGPVTGSGIGAMTNSGNVVFGASGNFVVQMQDVATGPGIGWDFLQNARNLGVLAPATNPFTINPISYDPNNSGLVTNFNENTNYNWTIATAAGGITNFAANKFIVDNSLFQNDLAGGYFFVRTNGNSLLLSFTNNHPPTAQTVTIYRTGNVMAIPLSTLSAGWSDPDGDPVTLTSVDSSTNGADLGSDGNFIYYTNASGSADVVFYTVQDVRTNPPAAYRDGDTQRTAVGEIIILPPPAISGFAASGNNLIFSGTGGKPNALYYLLDSTNLAAPMNLWPRVLTNNFDANGDFLFTNTLGTDGQLFFLLQVQ